MESGNKKNFTFIANLFFNVILKQPILSFQLKFSEIKACSCEKFSCEKLGDVPVVEKATVDKKRSILDELDELDEIDKIAGSRKRRAINLHELGSLADMVKQKRANKFRK